MAAKLLYKYKYFPYLTWIYWCSAVVLMFHNDGLSFLKIGTGQVIAWEDVFRFYSLRGISFNIELRANINYVQNDSSLKEQANPCEECKEGTLCQRILVDVATPLDKFDFLNYFIYIFYVPLYFAGPIITFNSFIYQMDAQNNAKISKSKIIYLVRTAFIYFGFELFNRLCPITAFIAFDANVHLWKEYSNFEITLYGWFLLIFIWFKLNLIWKVSRSWALMDGIKTEENMGRCLGEHGYSIQDFWRNWHKSFNQWLIRYIYMPFGGNKTKSLSIWVIFVFVALWHELKFKLLMWAITVCLLMMAEIQYTSWVNTKFVIF